MDCTIGVLALFGLQINGKAFPFIFVLAALCIYVQIEVEFFCTCSYKILYFSNLLPALNGL